MIHQRHRQTGGQTDGQTTCDSKTTLCAVVHRAVKSGRCISIITNLLRGRILVDEGSDTLLEERETHIDNVLSVAAAAAAMLVDYIVTCSALKRQLHR